MRTVGDVDWSSVDFLDVGAGRGGSLESAAKRIGGRGVGIDADPRKVEKATAAGNEVVLGDIFELPDISVRYLVLDNVLEHLPFDRVEEALAAALRVAREFVYIRHPSFEDEAYLACLGLKQHWHDWPFHTAHLLLSDFMRMFARLEVPAFVAHPVKAAWDSTGPLILPADTQPDWLTGRYDEQLHGPKPVVRFDRPVYEAFDLVAAASDRVSAIKLQYPEDPETSSTHPYVKIAFRYAERVEEQREELRELRRQLRRERERRTDAKEQHKRAEERARELKSRLDQVRGRRVVRAADAVGRLLRR